MNEHEYIPYTAASVVGHPPCLVLAPHPDDEVLGCAGAILSHRAAGNAVDVVIVTDGSRGIVDSTLSEDAIRRIRMDESNCAAEILGYGRPAYWNYPDRGLECDDALVERLHTLIERNGYRSLFAPSLLEIHPDHRHLAQACLMVAARLQHPFELCFYEVGQPLHPNRLLDISPYIETKRRAIACFASQVEVQNYQIQNEGLNRFRTYTLPKDTSHAEAYSVIDSGQARRAVDCLERTAMLPLGRIDLDQAMQRVDAALQEKQLELDRANADLQTILHSRSWQITSPLRRLYGWLVEGAHTR